MNYDYKLTVGLEIHAALKTKTKMFCQSANDPNEKRPNINICPICLGHPGTLPVINKEAVKNIIRIGLAIDGKIANFTEFDRKNYFYPDIPKGYQISQYQHPIVVGGMIGEVAISRVHLEEDTARSQHDPKTAESLMDFNRAGVPLMELVTEPVIKSAKAAVDFARQLKLLLGPAYLNVSEANMEKGEMRIEANVSISKNNRLGTKVEVKNLNSFRVVEKAIEFEYQRQVELLEKDEPVTQETRGWDEIKEVTFSQRQKEFSHDYRYFPDPDLPKLYLNEIAEFADLAKTLPELPAARRRRLIRDFGIKGEDIEVFVTDPTLGVLFEETANGLGDKNFFQTIANYLTSDLAGLAAAGKNRRPEADELVELMVLIKNGEISSRGAKDILAGLAETAGRPREIAKVKGLFQKSDTKELAAIVEKIIVDNPQVAAAFKAGNEKVLQFLIGQGMKESQGAANPAVLAKLFKEKINK